MDFVGLRVLAHPQLRLSWASTLTPENLSCMSNEEDDSISR